MWAEKKFFFDGSYLVFINLVKNRHPVGGEAKVPHLAIGAASDAVIVNRDLLRQLAGAVADGVDDSPGQGAVEVFILQGFLAGQGLAFCIFLFYLLGIWGWLGGRFIYR